MRMATLRIIPTLLFCFGVAYAADQKPSSELKVSAKSAIIVDEATGQILYKKDIHTPRYPASTTKIMTGMLLIENCLPTDWIVAPKGVDKIERSSMNLRVGEKVSARGMLYALMLRSANDGCVAVAHHISGSVPEFSKLMNKRAKDIGCLHTNFNNPNGLNDKKHTTTAYDLSLMAREAMKYEEFRQVVKTQKKTIVRSMNHEDLLMKSHNRWLEKDETADGIKTGFTRDAGRCYVGSVTRDGYRIITVILNSEDWQVDHKAMVEWVYANHKRTIAAPAGAEVSRIPVPNSTPEALSVVTNEDVSYLKRSGVEPKVEVNLTSEVKAPLSAGTQVGEATFSDSTGWRKTVPVVAATSLEPDPFILSTMGGKAGFGILSVALIGGVASLRSRRRARFYAKTSRSTFF